MAHDATLHVKIDPATNEQLARLAAARKTSKGQLVRDAIFACYQVNVRSTGGEEDRAGCRVGGGSRA